MPPRPRELGRSVLVAAAAVVVLALALAAIRALVG